MMIIFKENYYYSEFNKNYIPGEIVDMEEEIANELIKDGIAKVYNETDKPIEGKSSKIENKFCKLIYPGKVAPDNYWFINDDGEAFIKEKTNQNIQKIEVQKDFNFQAVNDKIINFKKGDIVYLTEGQFMAMKNLGYI